MYVNLYNNLVKIFNDKIPKDVNLILNKYDLIKNYDVYYSDFKNYCKNYDGNFNGYIYNYCNSSKLIVLKNFDLYTENYILIDKDNLEKMRINIIKEKNSINLSLYLNDCFYIKNIINYENKKIKFEKFLFGYKNNMNYIKIFYKKGCTKVIFSSSSDKIKYVNENDIADCIFSIQNTYNDLYENIKNIIDYKKEEKRYGK